jgi:hypothetical protein
MRLGVHAATEPDGKKSQARITTVLSKFRITVVRRATFCLALCEFYLEEP